jgi:hypothetical protein
MNTATSPTDAAYHTQYVANGRRSIGDLGPINARLGCKSFDHDGSQAAGHLSKE